MYGIEDFFKSYQHGFDTFDAEEISSHYNVPSSICDGDGLCTYSDRQSLVRKFESNCESFRSAGYHGSQFSIGLFHNIGVAGIIVDLGWRVELRKGPTDFRAAYTCIAHDNTWRIFNVVTYSE